MGIIKAFKLGFDYLKYDEDGNVEATQRAVNDVNLDIEAGQFVAVLGHNGSGKSSALNFLFVPVRGTCYMPLWFFQSLKVPVLQAHWLHRLWICSQQR